MNESIVQERIITIKNLLDNNPTNSELLNDLGVGYYLIGNYADSIESLSKAVELKPKNITYRYNLANSYSELEEFSKAKYHYLIVLEESPEHIPSLNNLADCYEAIGEKKRALELFEYLTKIAPGNALAHFNYGNFLLRSGDHIQATKSYEMAIKIEPSFSDAYLNIAWILFEVKAYQKSLEYLLNGLKEDPEHEDLKKLLSKVRNHIR